MLAASLNARELQQIPSNQTQTLELNNSLKYTDFRNNRFSPEPDCRSTDLFHQSTGRSTGCPTESWALTVRFYRSTGQPTGCPTESWALTVRDCGRPPSDPVHAVHVGRPGRSTDQPVFCCCCYFLLLFPSPFVVDFLGDHLDDLSAILINFPISKLSLSNRRLQLG